jgi:rod shape-determining protein MreD
MRWFNFAILVMIVLVLQVGITRLFSIGSQNIMPDLLLMVAVILAFRGQGYSVLIACWVLGLVRDLSSDAVLGTYAIAFGLVALMVSRLHQFLYVDRPLSVILVTFVSAFAVEQFAILAVLLRGDLKSGQYGSLTLSILLSALFTAVLAPYAQWLILKIQRLIGLPRNQPWR